MDDYFDGSDVSNCSVLESCVFDSDDQEILKGPNLKIEVILVFVRGEVSANLLQRHF